MFTSNSAGVIATLVAGVLRWFVPVPETLSTEEREEEEADRVFTGIATSIVGRLRFLVVVVVAAAVVAWALSFLSASSRADANLIEVRLGGIDVFEDSSFGRASSVEEDSH